MPTDLPILSDRFEPPDAFSESEVEGYQLLPIRFHRLDSGRYVATNLVGEYQIFSRHDLDRFVRHRLPPDSKLYDKLKSKHMLSEGNSPVALDLLATKYRTRLSNLPHLTGLFLFVTTLRCDHSCPYCQVSRQSEDKAHFDMTPEMADRAVDLMFQSPSPYLKVEFQGGESLLNFEIIKRVIERTEKLNRHFGRDIESVIATNLSPISDEHLQFCQAHSIAISTSLDGPRELHNYNRPNRTHDSYEHAVAGIERCRKALGLDRVSALMTTTTKSLSMPETIVDEYVRLGFRSIFLRSMSPYGFAARSQSSFGYDIDAWLTFFRSALNHILRLNLEGISIREEASAILLRKILTPFPSGYVDLQSPAGIGIGAMVFNYNGDIYASDESRMLAEMGDKSFRLGNVFADDFQSLFRSKDFLAVLRDTMTEGVPMCAECAFQPYCGSDPVGHRRLQQDVVGFKPSSEHCRKYMGMIRHLLHILEDRPDEADILRSWAWS